ncbi:MAG TPA: Mur ligase family protein [Candidatus Saccharibacteria bacterium]|nr:Mur ligase family protein [Candidatus Saccharibacteria bacterium]
MFKNIVQRKLERYVRKYFKKHPDIRLVVVAGSVGKTSTKVAIATVLSESFRVRLNEGNLNTHMSTPLAILGIKYPDNIKSIKEWLAVFKSARTRIKSPTDVDIIVQELGSDRIGETEHFGRYLKPDIGVVTAVSPEHMEFFKNIDNVAKEELAVANFSKQALINREDIEGEFAKYLTNVNMNTYGTSSVAEYNFTSTDYSIENGHEGTFKCPEYSDSVFVKIHVYGEHSLRPAIAGAAVAVKFNMNPSEIVSGLSKIRPQPGRMNILKGYKNSIIIDDTYNSSPLAAEMALREVYKISSPQRIVVLGSMNELGDVSAEEHKKLGEMCDMNELAWVITVGDEAEKYLAPASRAKGCQVRCFKTSIQAGIFVKSIIEEGAVVLFKGSQGDIFLEEAVKIMLHSTEDEKQLVRQSSAWMKTKEDFFSANLK